MCIKDTIIDLSSCTCSFHACSAGAFLEAIENLGFDYIASGHYAHVVHPSVQDVESSSELQLSKDKVLCIQINIACLLHCC
jgi:tRNA U34 2-thiouridine synthase MnmA/TrmU